mgnify:CR=1 FL=1
MPLPINLSANHRQISISNYSPTRRLSTYSPVYRSTILYPSIHKSIHSWTSSIYPTVHPSTTVYPAIHQSIHFRPSFRPLTSLSAQQPIHSLASSIYLQAYPPITIFPAVYQSIHLRPFLHIFTSPSTHDPLPILFPLCIHLWASMHLLHQPIRYWTSIHLFTSPSILDHLSIYEHPSIYSPFHSSTTLYPSIQQSIYLRSFILLFTSPSIYEHLSSNPSINKRLSSYWPVHHSSTITRIYSFIYVRNYQWLFIVVQLYIRDQNFWKMS